MTVTLQTEAYHNVPKLIKIDLSHNAELKAIEIKGTLHIEARRFLEESEVAKARYVSDITLAYDAAVNAVLADIKDQLDTYIKENMPNV